jgi:hypothetical protein
MIAQHVSAKASYAAVSGLNKSRGARAVRARRAIARAFDRFDSRALMDDWWIRDERYDDDLDGWMDGRTE